ncbi:uncharacterized protein ACLA_013680 [Aspergillus clavatus NRRL 1]|uniref:Uncharacterized protein n=1 Tax=Aspergillus clavatus (strain ATCC 1007 / CBS 513.65 / DSM 816 / NCTC 3887 / NRRL 1 / QM 1276 / 107) TaxID=344612 RepID=A1CB13_ASPCL|nr:uncharacterized protein ACLA_013680 [Aspergillus clavatus NRRL 1]EAW12931.1 conserved hypothetical protein [Aspergillus clavatus NRRL 1]
MARRYEIDELLWLRSSPLVSKPAGLPPIDEWMGPIPDSTVPRKPTNTRDPTNPNEATPRRPSLFETRHISRNSNSEDIVLGPPKTAFASASRISGKGSLDFTDRTPRPTEPDEASNDRFNFRDKFFKEREAGDRDLDRRDGKPSPFNGRRGEREDWNNGRPRRTFGQDEQERKTPRRNGEFDRWNRDQRDQTFERGIREKEGQFVPRKDGTPSRARHEGSWFRDDNAQDVPETEEEKLPARNREWRRDKHGADRDWTRGARIEQDPEWMDANDRDETRRVHTQEDFERWKERMKASSSQPHVEEKKETSIEVVASKIAQPEHRPTDGDVFSGNGTPFQADSAMERFFGLLGDAKQPQEVSTPISVESTSKKEPAQGKLGKSSRFAGLFSPPPGSPATEPEAQFGIRFPAPQSSSSDADQEGFQRILQMLGGSGSRNSTPQNDGMQPSRPPLMQPEPTLSALSSPKDSIKRPDYVAMPEASARSTAPSMQENIQAHQSPFRNSQAQDREHLLRLMQQVRVSPVANHHGVQGQHPGAGPAPGMMNMPEMLSRPPGIPSAQKAPPFLDDPAIANMQRPDADQIRRRPANGPPMGYFDDVLFPQGGQIPITPGGSRPPPGPGHPGMGIQRPPGFEHLPPPGWTGPQVPPPPPPQQGGGPSPLAPPPGIPTPNRGVNPNFMMPMHGNVPPLAERQLFPRGAGGNGSVGFPPPPPPGMMPPPGYMNGPPPSGFPPMVPNGEALLGLGHGGQGPFDGNPGPQQGPPPSSRHLLDMFGQVGGPGQFR